MITKTIRSNLTVSTVAAVVLLASGQFFAVPSAHAASSEIFDVDPSMQARIAREKIKQRGPRRGARQGDGSSNSDNCGQVDIGNNNTQRNARSRVNPRVNITVVQGPVINAARCR